MLIIQSIRQFDNPFIPLSFHWSGRYIKPQTVQKLCIHDCYTRLFCNTPCPWVLEGKLHHILSAIQILNLALCVRNLNPSIICAYFQWKTRGCSWPGIIRLAPKKKIPDWCRYNAGKQIKSHPDICSDCGNKKNDADHAGELVSSNRYFQTTAAITAPMTGATRNSQSCASAVPPATTAGPRLRAGFTEVPVTGIVTI